MTIRAQMLMYGREAQSKTRIASPATIPKSGERNRKTWLLLCFAILRLCTPNPFLTQRFIPTHMTVRELPSLRKEYFHP